MLYGIHTVRGATHPVLERRIRSVRNYTNPLPDPLCESALRGRHYDQYLRWILAEGLGVGTARTHAPAWWPDWKAWMACPILPRRVANYSDPVYLPTCPLAWSEATHALGCTYATAPPVPPVEARSSLAVQLLWAPWTVPKRWLGRAAVPNLSEQAYVAPVEMYVPLLTPGTK